VRVTNKARYPCRGAQCGFALIALLAILATGMLYFLVGQLDTAAMQRRQDEVTTQALAQAKEALIAYAVAANINDVSDADSRPGDLPCPDRDNDGKAGTTIPLVTSCGNAAGTTFQERRLGRLPWISLGLPDLRDGSGERLWYAVSNNFKKSTRKFPLNSDTTGTITIRDSSGNILFDGSGISGAVAVVIAPGPPITRLDDLQQDRTAANANDPKHYLDSITVEDNADFGDNSTNGFFGGPVRDAADPTQVIANDRLIVITREEIVAAIEKRVAAEVMNCLVAYAADSHNGGRYPWAAHLAGYAISDYGDTTNTTFGRVPDLMCRTAGDAISLPCNTPPAGTNPAMQPVWPASCTITNGWFKDNWREQVFYAVADAYRPGTGPPSCGTCLSIDGVGGKQVAVVVVGKKVGAQTRTDKSDPAQYLEDINSSGGTSYVTKSANPPFNDWVLYR
jgi:hypothetical protein